MKYFEKHPMLVLAVGLLGASLSSIFIKHSSAPSAVNAAYRLVITVALLTPVVLGKAEVRREIRGTPRRLVLLSGLSGLFLAVHFLLWFESLKHTTVAAAATIVSTEVIWVCIGFCLFMKGKITPKAGLCIAATLLGSAVIAWGDFGSGQQLYGDILALLAAAAMAVYTLIGRTVRKEVSTTVYTYLVYVTCAAALLCTCAVQGASMTAWGWSPVVVGLLLAVFSTILGHSIFSWSLKYFSPAFVSASKLSEPVVASVIAAFLLSEVPTLPQIAGGALVIAGIFFYSRLESKSGKA